MKSTQSKRKPWIKVFAVIILIIGGSTIAEKGTVDPLDKAMGALEVAVNNVMIDPESDYQLDTDGNFLSGSIGAFLTSRGYDKKDRIVDFEKKEFQDVLGLVRGMKKIIDKESHQRDQSAHLEMLRRTKELLATKKTQQQIEDESAAQLNLVQSEYFGKFAVIVSRYFKIQKRLYANQIRNAYRYHNSKLLNATLLNDLNLKLNLAVGGYLEAHSDYYLQYNLWHSRNPDTHVFDRVELGLTPEEKSEIELIALEENKNSEIGYSKLIHFLALRARIVNQWAVERLSRTATKLAPPKLVSCGTPDENFSALASFQDHSNTLTYSPGNYYDFLWKKDRYEEFDGELVRQNAAVANQKKDIIPQTILGQIAPKTLSRPLMSGAQFRATAFQFFNELSGRVLPAQEQSAKTEASATPTASIDPMEAAMEAEKAKQLAKVDEPHTPEQYFGDYFDQEIQRTEKLWNDKVRASLLTANFMEDRWDDESVAERTALYAFKFRKKILTETLFYQALTLGHVPALANDADYEVWFKKASDTMSAALSAVEASWIEKLKQDVLQTLKSPEVKQIRLLAKDCRLKEKMERLKPSIMGAVKANYVNAKIDELIKANINNGNWRATKKVYFGSGLDPVTEFELGYIATTGRMGIRLKPWLPDQLVKFFTAKMEYWKTHAHPKRSYMPTLVKKIEDSRQVMWGVKNFFLILNNMFMTYALQSGVNPYTVAPENTPLYHVLVPAAKKAVQEFLVAIKEKPVLLNPQPKSAFTGDNLKSPIKPQYDFKNSVPTSQQAEVTALFVQAMSVLNLGQFITSHADGLDRFSDEALKDLEPDSKQKLYPLYKAPTFLAMEMFLAKESLFTTTHPEVAIENKLMESFLDQRIFSEVIKAEATDNHPILAIQYQDQSPMLQGRPDDLSPTVMDLMGQYYDPKAGGLSDAKILQSLNLGLDRATDVIPKLINEACIAKPSVEENVAFRNIFRASRALRSTYFENDPKMSAIDEKIVKFTRTPTEKARDTLWKWYGYGLAVLGVIILLYVTFGTGVTLLGTISQVVASLGSIATMQTLSLKGAWFIANFVVFNGIAAYQLALQYKITCIELPNQYRYQMNLANSQTNEFANTQIKKNDLKWLRNNIDSEYTNLMFGVATQAAMLPQLIGSFKVAAGVFGLKALKGFDVAGDALTVARQTERINEVRALTQADWIASEGVFKGTLKFWSQQLQGVLANGEAFALHPLVSMQAVYKLGSVRLAKIFKTTTAIEEIVTTNNAEIEASILKLSKEAQKNEFIRARLASYGSIATWGDFIKTLQPALLWEETGYHLKNFLAKIPGLNRHLKLVLSDDVIAKLDVGYDLVWDEANQVFTYFDAGKSQIAVFSKESAFFTATESAAGNWTRLDAPTAFEIRQLSIIARIKELALKRKANDEFLSALHQAREAAYAPVPKAPVNGVVVEEAMGTSSAEMLGPDATLLQEQKALELIFDYMADTKQWPYVHNLLTWATKSFPGGVPSEELLAVRAFLKDSEKLMEQAEKLESIAEKNQAKLKQMLEEAMAKKEAKEWTTAEEVMDHVYDVDWNETQIVVDPSGAVYGPNKNFIFRSPK